MKGQLRRSAPLAISNLSIEKSGSSPLHKDFSFTGKIAIAGLCSLLLGGCLPDLGGGSSGDSSLSSNNSIFPGSNIVQCSTGPADLSGACRNTAAPTPGALEAIVSQVEVATAALGGFAAAMPTSDGSVPDTLNIAWSPPPESVSGYLVYYGSTPETATTLASDVSSNTSNFDASAPSISYQPLQDLGLSTGDTVCFRIQAYDTAGVTYSWSEVQCTAV